MHRAVSIIIPCFNVQDFIVECIESVVNQTYKGLEVICIDNNSTDKTLNKLNNLKQKYPFILIEHEKTAGASAARNKGLFIAKGEWIQFLDADDLIMPEKIAHQLSLLNQENVVPPFIATSSFKKNVKGIQRVHHPEPNPWKGVFSTNLGITSANLFNREAIIKVGGWNAEIKSSQEYDLMFRLLKTFGPPLIDNTPLTIIRERESGQISQRNPKEKWQQYLDLRIQMIEYLKLHQTEEWIINEEYYLNKFFTKLRLYAKEDLTDAALIYFKLFPNSFAPEKSVYISKFYRILFQLLGFEKTEKLHKLLRS